MVPLPFYGENPPFVMTRLKGREGRDLNPSRAGRFSRGEKSIPFPTQEVIPSGGIKEGGVFIITNKQPAAVL